MNLKDSPIRCPICQQKLTPLAETRAWGCAQNHQFDVAKQGYLNLLPSHQKNSRIPGDSPEMVLARRLFLEAGHFQWVSDALNQAICDFVSGAGSPSTLDIGCGEGYYLGRLLPCLNHKYPDCRLYGFDISKDAVKKASGQHKGILWMVANSHRIPLEAHSMEGAISVFSPVSDSELLRVLKPGGAFVRVLPTEDHLIELRNLIYKTVQKNTGVAPVSQHPGLNHVETRIITYPILLDEAGLKNLLVMTPHYWKTGKADKERIEGIGPIEMTISMRLEIYTAP